MRRRKIKFSPGDVFTIPLPDGRYGIGQVLDHGEYAVFKAAYSSPPPVEAIIGSPVAFRIWVMNSAISSGRWPIIGSATIEPALQDPADFFMQDVITGELSIYRPIRPIPATYEQCLRLENAAAWSAHHVEERLADELEGRPSRWVEAMRPKLPK